MTNFNVLGEGELASLYLTDADLLDRYIGNTLWNWGHNNIGMLGTNNTTHRSSPVQTIAGGVNWRLVSCAGYHTLGIKTDGTLWLWGIGTSGQIGNNASTNRSSPVQTVAGGTNWRDASGGRAHSSAIKSDGSLWSWGSSAAGQMGNNSLTGRSSPVQTIAGGNNWKLVSCGGYNTAAIKTDGTLWTWGYNDVGQLGDNSKTHRSSPVQTVAGGTDWKKLSAGYNHCAGIKEDGTLWLWGYNNAGQLGDNTTIHRSSPVQTIAGGNNWKQVACGDYYTAAIKDDGTLWSWGIGSEGQIGNNVAGNVSSPVQTVAGGTDWKQVALGSYTTMAIKNDGTLWGWGRGVNGNLGDSSVSSKSSPVQTSLKGTNWKQVSVGVNHTAAVTYRES